MNAIPIPSEVLCRPALPSDRESVMGFLPLIAEGEDYVPDVWDDWLEDDHGLLAAALMEGRVVGLSHLADLGRGEWWLEGLRVDPRLQGRHIGSQLHNYQVENWLRTDGTALRLITHQSRTAVHRMCDRTGFRKVASAVALRFPNRSGAHRFRPARVPDAERALSRLHDSTVQRGLGGWMDLGWRYAEVAAERVSAAAESGGLWTWGEDEGILVIRAETEADRSSLTVSAMAPPTGDRTSFLSDIPKLAASMGIKSGLWIAPENGAALEGAAQAGFTLESDDPLWLFERRR